MYMDQVVIAGVAVVVLTMAFFGGVYYMIKKDQEKHPH